MAEVGIGILVQCKPRCLFAVCAARSLPTPITKHTVETVFTAGTVAEGTRLVFAKWRRDDLLAAAALGHRLGCKFLAWALASGGPAGGLLDAGHG